MDKASNVMRRERLDALLEEYRALYGIALLRMNALDKRVPVTAGAMAAVIATLDVVSADSQLILLATVPLALVWFVRATAYHARSFEDVLRRIDQIEEAVNSLLGRSVMRFQSRHPSRGREVGGRTGRECVSTVLATSLVVLGAAGFRMHRGRLLPVDWEIGYVLTLTFVGALALREGIQLSQYRYTPIPNLGEPSG